MWRRIQRKVRLSRKKVTSHLGEDLVSYETGPDFNATIYRLRGDQYEHLPAEIRRASTHRAVYINPQDIIMGDRIGAGLEVYTAVGDEEKFVKHCEVILKRET